MKKKNKMLIILNLYKYFSMRGNILGKEKVLTTIHVDD